MQYTANDLKGSLGYPGKRVYARIDAVSAQFPGVVETGKNNKKFVSDRGFAILRRLKELEDDGHSIETAMNKIVAELKEHEQNNEKPTLTQTETTGKQNDLIPAKELITVLKEQLRAKDSELERVMGLLEQSQGQIRAMLPTSSATRQRLGRWAALRAVLTGRV